MQLKSEVELKKKRLTPAKRAPITKWRSQVEGEFKARCTHQRCPPPAPSGRRTRLQLQRHDDLTDIVPVDSGDQARTVGALEREPGLIAVDRAQCIEQIIA